MRIFTDGSCLANPGPGGWAFAVALDDGVHIEKGYELKTTNNRMEIYSVISAISYGIQKGAEQIIIYSDSAYVVNAITKGWLSNWMENGWKTKTGKGVKNKDLWQHLEMLLNKIQVQFVKVKGHSGNTLNELVDKEARNAATFAYKTLGVEGNE